MIRIALIEERACLPPRHLESIILAPSRIALVTSLLISAIGLCIAVAPADAGWGAGYGRFEVESGKLSGATEVVNRDGAYPEGTGNVVRFSGTGAVENTLTAHSDDTTATGVFVIVKIASSSLACATSPRPTITVSAKGGRLGTSWKALIANGELGSWSDEHNFRVIAPLSPDKRPALGDNLSFRIVANGTSATCGLDVDRAGYANLAYYDPRTTSPRTAGTSLVATSTPSGDTSAVRIASSGASITVKSPFAQQGALRVTSRATKRGCTGLAQPVVRVQAVDALGAVIWSADRTLSSTAWSYRQYSDDHDRLPMGWTTLRITAPNVEKSCGAALDFDVAYSTLPSSSD
jgi:hypothetical protein